MQEQILILIAMSFAAGTFGSLLGLGGGFIIVPTLSFLGYNPYQIASTSLFSVLSTSASSTIAYARQKRIEYSLGIRLAVAAIPGTILGAYISDFISIQSFKLYFAIILIATAFYILRRASLTNRDPRTGSIYIPISYSASFFAGIISSLFGIGGGVIFMPLLIVILGMSMHISAPTSQFILFISSIVGLITHSALGHPDYLLALILIAGTFGGAQLGARISLFMKEALLRRLASLALFGVAIKMISELFE